MTNAISLILIILLTCLVTLPFSTGSSEVNKVTLTLVFKIYKLLGTKGWLTLWY